MRESPCEFGPELNLMGILSEPATTAADPSLPIVLLLNSGYVHHVGLHRMAVELARRLADRGITSLRFDLSGLGESELTRKVESPENRPLADIGAAIDYFENKLAIHKFVLLGVCSGAANAHAAALRDSRVVGAVLLDGYAYWTWGSYVVHYFPRFFRLRPWLNFLRGKIAKTKSPGANFNAFGNRPPFGTRLDVKQEIQMIVDRGTQLLYVYTSGVSYYYNYAKQFGDMFRGLDSKGNIDVVYYPNADHTFMFSEDRDRMFARIVEWYRSRNWNTG